MSEKSSSVLRNIKLEQFEVRCSVIPKKVCSEACILMPESGIDKYKDKRIQRIDDPDAQYLEKDASNAGRRSGKWIQLGIQKHVEKTSKSLWFTKQTKNSVGASLVARSRWSRATKSLQTEETSIRSSWTKFLVATSNNPRIIGRHYIELVQKLGYLPTLMRTDHGTEVILMEDFHVALRQNHLDANAGEHSFLKGKSTHDQRIESWWRQLRQKMCDFYIHLFRGMEEAQILDVNDPLHIETLRFCFGNLIKADIENTRKEWNEHRIRKQNNHDVVSGRPNKIFHFSRETRCPRLSKRIGL
ncbi:hypothetical protein QAD02_011656 [Eretmocerus hayati]|uniref:Uncharacterized protein n=1 Tax=Eretmocerus hayati TaxID=131215 RepID=A0ACC2P271_9HYME|nr:hypothetical protein QAD02_011656 [Eretmocerus hayati]